jgi:serine/threonine protein kinase
MNTIPRKLGRYVIIREIGRGAMGVVYKAHDPVIEREVAIKAIQIAFEVTPEEKGVFLSRFNREAKAAGKLSHPNIVTIFDVDEDKETGTPFIVMEFLEGTTISEVASSGVLLPLEDVNNMIIQLADALNYAHNEGVVHRDIKAANILVLSGMKVKIMDFGIARLPSSDLTQSGQFIGTPNYMSPEQIEGKSQVDGRSDLFSLGVIFYMLLTGERPFSGDSFNTVSYRIVNVHHVPPRTLNPNVPEVYNAILTRLLAKDPEERYQTGSELVADVKKLMANISEIEELRESDLESTIAGPPPQPPEARGVQERITGRTKTVPPGSLSLSGTGSSKRATSLVALIGLVLVLTAGSIYFIQSASSKKEAALAPPPASTTNPNNDALVALSRQNALRIKWDLAMKYMESGLYDKSILELNGILQNDPSNEDARKLLELVQEKKQIEEKKKSEPAAPQTIPIAQVPLRPPKVVKPVEQPITVDLAPAVKMAAVDFDFEHGFPSGSVYIFTNEKLAFEGSLSGEEKKVLIFRNYKGKLSGSLKIPVGETNILVHVVCKEKSVSASKRITVNVTESSQPHSLHIKYLKSPKQLELKWI